MVHIILLIFKIAGIVLLSLLGIVLLLLGALLFVPVTYRVYAKKEEKTIVHAVGGWMFRMLSVHYRLDENGQDIVLRILGIPVYRPGAENQPGRSSRKKKKQKRQQRAASPRKQPSEQKSKPAEEQQSEQQSETVIEQVLENRPGSAPAAVSGPKRAEDTDKKGVFARLVYAIRRICDRIKSIWNACRKIPHTIRSLLDRKDQLLEFWDLEEHRRAREALWKEFLYLRDKIRPRKIRGHIHFGFEDPAMTGICMGAASVLYAWYPEKFELRPDFDRQILEGEIFFRGKLRLYVLLLIGLRIWFNQDIRLMYAHWKEL